MIEKEPFVRYKTDEEKAKEKDVRFTVRLNAKEIEAVKLFQRALDIKSRGTALKTMALIGHNVMTSLLGRHLFVKLFKKERVRLSDYESF